MKYTLPQNVSVALAGCCDQCDIAEIVTEQTAMNGADGYEIDAWQISCSHIEACLRMRDIYKGGEQK